MINFMFRMWVLEACTALFSLIVLASLITAAVTNAEIIIRVKIISQSQTETRTTTPPSSSTNNDEENNSNDRQQSTSQPSGQEEQQQQPQQGNNNGNSSNNNNENNRCSRTCTIVRIGEDFLVMLLTGVVSFYFMLVLSEMVYIPKPSHILADNDVYIPKLSQIVEFVVMRII